MGKSRLRTLKLLGDWCCNVSVCGCSGNGRGVCSINSSTSVDRNRGSSGARFSFCNFNPETALILLLVLFSTFSITSQESCPSGCECKWKSGKESVTCTKGTLREIPQGLDPNTQVLELPGCLIERLPSQVFQQLNLVNLQKIFLTECQLVSLESDTFAKLSNLIELELSGNRFNAIPSHTFDQIPELRDLKLNSNPIVRISNDAFVPLPRLVRLELTGCRIGTIDAWAFRGLPVLQWLRLDNNRLLTVPAESFFPLRSLHGLEIAGNPWNCSCTLQPWRDWMIKNNVPFGIPPLCTYPKRLAGKSWDRLQLEDFACLPKLTSSTDQERISRVVEGENAALLCRLQTTPDTQIRWLNGNKGSGVVTNGSVGTMSSSSAFVLTESFVRSGSPYTLENEFSSSSSSSSHIASFDEFGAMRYKSSRPNVGDRSLGVKISKLTIIRATPREAGLYICTAETKAGLVSANFTLHVAHTKTENLTGRVLFTGAVVAALMLILVCLLLVCVMIGSRRLHYAATASRSLTTEEKIELNHVGQNRQNHDHEGQNGGSNIPLMRDHDDHHGPHDHEDDCKSIIIGPKLTNHYPNSQSPYSAPARPPRPSQLPNAALTRNGNNISHRNDLSQNLMTTLRKNIPETNHSVPSSSSSTTVDQPGRSHRSTRGCEYKVLPVNDPDDDDDDDDYDDNNNSSNDGGGESGSDESSTPVVEIINNNHRRNKMTVSAGRRAARADTGIEPPPFTINNGADSTRNIVSNGSSSKSCSNSNDNQPNHSHNINKRHSMFSASVTASPNSSAGGGNPSTSTGNNNNNNHARNSYDVNVTPGTNTAGMRSVVGTPQRKAAIEPTTGSHNPFITSSPSTSYSQQKQRDLYRLEQELGVNSRYPDLVNEKLPNSSMDYTSLPRPNKNRDPRIGSYFHRRNNSTDSQYPLISSSYGNSLDGISASSTDLPFVSSSNPDSLSRLPPSSYVYSRPASTNYIYQSQYTQPHQPYLRHHSNSGQLLRNHSPAYTAGTKGTNWSQRLSMPTSPVHEKHFASASSIPPSSYDYHAAQLAAFLEEYRILQMELIRMSSSLTSSNTNSLNKGDSVEYGASTSAIITSSVNMPNPSNNNHSNSNNSPSSRLFVSSNQQHYGSTPSHGSAQQEQQRPNGGSNPISVTNSPRSGFTHQQPPPTIPSASANSANYFSNAAYGLTKPPLPARPPSLLPNATNNVLGPSEYQNKQNLKSILKNPATIGNTVHLRQGASSTIANAMDSTGQGITGNSNHNNNYDITFH